MKYLKKYDLIIILIILVISFLSWISYQYLVAGQSPKAEIYHYAELIKTVELDQGLDKYFFIEENPNIVFHLFEDGSISFKESDCPHKLCIKAGKLSRPGQFAACLPNGIILKIVPAERTDRDIDIVVGN